uniref:putative F-box protein At3g47150 n=1 Tax=Erigeron canadensis TaxID=72917 RepID=UPI001CB9D6C2|nr:putative F-box protein At3g47150 [Erigeron canadensis]
MEKLKALTLNEKEDVNQTTATSILFPNEIIQDILSRLPIKPLLQFKSVSKQWLSLISHDPSFPKLHFSRSLATNRAALLVTAYDYRTEKRHFLSAPVDGGSVTHLIALDNAPPCDKEPTTEAQHLNGRPYPKIRKLSFMECVDMRDITPTAIEFMIYSLSTYSWRKVDVKEEDLPIDIFGKDWYLGSIPSVCVNSVIHMMLEIPNKILAFDLMTDKFSTIDIPWDAIPREILTTWFDSRGMRNVKANEPYLMDINGCLGLVCHDRVVERNKMYLWILQDYESRVWVEESVTFTESWSNLSNMYPVDSVVGMDKVLFSIRRISLDEVIVPIYDMKTKGVQLVRFTLSQEFLRSNTMEFGEVRSYVESILPLEKNEEGLHEDDN